MNATNEIRAKIESLMGWRRGESRAFGLRTLQSFVRGKDPKFDEELSLYLDRGEHFFVNPQCSHDRKVGECDVCDALADRADTTKED